MPPDRLSKSKQEIWGVISTRFGHLARMIPQPPPAFLSVWLSRPKLRSTICAARRTGADLGTPTSSPAPAGSGKRALAAGVAELVNGAPVRQDFRGQGAGNSSRQSGIEVASDWHRPNPRTRTRAADAGERWSPQGGDHIRGGPNGTQAANAFLKTLEEPPNNSLLLLLSAIPEVLPETIRSRCIAMSLASPTDHALSSEEEELVELLNLVDPTADGVHEAYRLVQGFQRLLVKIRQTIQEENDAAPNGRNALQEYDRRRPGWKSGKNITKR